VHLATLSFRVSQKEEGSKALHLLLNLGVWGAAAGAYFVGVGDELMSLRNAMNTVQIRDHSENIGFYYYMMVETFQKHLAFFEMGYQLFLLCLVGTQVHLFHSLNSALRLNQKRTRA